MSVASAAALDISVVPPDPGTDEEVALEFVAGTCRPRPPVVTRNGATIDVEVRAVPGTVCIAAAPAAWVRARLGVLPAGIYTINVDNVGQRETREVVVRTTNFIRSVPGGAPEAGGTPVLLEYADFVGTTDTVMGVSFGGVDSERVSEDSRGIRAWAPPHAAGLVDVAVTYRDSEGNHYVVRSERAFFYWPDAAGVDLRFVEPVLFPLSFEGPGALGSVWKTENMGSLERPVIGCEECAGATRLPNRGADGHVLWFARDMLDREMIPRLFRSTITEVRGGTTHVVRPLTERWFRSPFHALFTPAQGERVTLRIWSLDPARVYADLTLIGSNGNSVDFILVMTRSRADALPFASLDLTPLLARLPSGMVQLRASGDTARVRLAGIVTLTDNATQAVRFVPEQE
jgi:hypothetical protein